MSWQLVSEQRGQKQTAYRLLAASTSQLLQQNQGDLWDSGKVMSDQSLHIRYAGKPLASRQRCFWKVQVWDKDGQATDFSSTAFWEMGLSSPADWKGADWIRLAIDTRTSPLTERLLKRSNMKEAEMRKAFAAPLFRRELSIQKEIKQARAYVCGLGYHEMYINGRRCGEAVLEPGQTTYDVRSFYVTHDISEWLRPGANAIGVMLGSGFFGQNHAFNTRALASGEPALIVKIVVDYTDGTTREWGTDSTWKAQTGPILYDNVYGGETYDARLEKDGWDKTGYDDSAWAAANMVAAPTPRLQAQMIPPIRTIQTLDPVQVVPGVDGKWLFDLGQNISGWAQIQLQAPAGTQLTIRYAELLSPDKTQLNSVTLGAFATGLNQTDIYICKGNGLETWSPRFTYHGFRYVEVEGLPGKPEPDFLKGVVVHSAVPSRGSFECSDEMLNRIYRASLWTIQNNLHSVLEDCPHREKCAWLGDTHATGETAIFNYDMAQFFTKFVDDIKTVQGRGGETYFGQKATPGIPCNIAVGRRLCREARPDWGSAYILVPWYLYTYYGDTDVLTRHYEDMKRWIDYVKKLREDGIVIRGFGDWCPPGGNVNMECPVPLTSTAFYYATLRIMEEFATLLEKNEDAAYFAEFAAETKVAFNRKFFNPETAGYGSQTADAVALRFDLSPDGTDQAVGQALRHGVVQQHDGHAFVGIHGGRPLYTQLCDYGYEAVAIDALKQPDWPSYGYMLSHGLTTWPEVPTKFDAQGYETSGRSLNHPMHSGFAAWFHEGIGGIRPEAPGFKQIMLKPYGYTRLQWAKVEHECPYGLITSDWQCKDGKFNWQITIPANTTATIYVPVSSGNEVTESGKPAEECKGLKLIRTENGRAVFEAQAGSYRIQS